MKCPRCKRTMKTIQAKEHVFYYECPNCHYTIGKPEEVKDAGDEGNNR